MEKIRVKVFSYDYRLLEESVKTIMAQLSHKGIIITGPIILPTKRKLYSGIVNIEKSLTSTWKS